MNQNTDFIYYVNPDRDSIKESHFETFLRYTNEKEASAGVIQGLLRTKMPQPFSFLDIGSGNGEFFNLIFKDFDVTDQHKFLLLEPSRDLFDDLCIYKSQFQNPSTIRTLCETFQQFSLDEKFSLILASHIYFIKRDQRYLYYSKMLDLLEDGGYLIVVLGSVDDFYEFKTLYKPSFHGPQFEAKTIEDSHLVFKELGSQAYALSTELFYSHSELKIPVQTDFSDSVAILEFLLEQRWSEMTFEIKQDLLSYLAGKNYKLKLTDGILLVRKNRGY